jgi:hypothetical protein
MAANIVAMTGADKVRAHSNSKFMFHGAIGLTWAGSEAHADTADLLKSVNADVIANLTALPRADKNQITGWFAEGREGWLSAQQALDMGLISEIIDAPAAGLVEIPKAEAEKLLEGGLDVAAFDFAEPQAATPPAPPAPPAGFVAVAELEALNARLAGLQSAKDKEIAALKTEHATALQAKEDALTAATGRITDFEAKLATMTAELGKVTTSLSAEVTDHATTKATLAQTGEQLTKAKAQHRALVGSVLKHDEAFAGWAEAVKELGYTHARKSCPELYDAYMAENKTKGKKG